MIRIHGLKVNVQKNFDLLSIVSKKLNVKKEKIKSLEIRKKSLDARSKEKFSYVFDIDISVENEDKYLCTYISKVEDESYHLPVQGNDVLCNRPVIIGSGPAGLFCSYFLAKYGYKPIIIERGEKIEDRIKSVNQLWQHGKLNENSNVQFGEGGAGTFSDGKLNTLVKNKENRMQEIFKIFVECGAPKNIMYDNMPHIGTDILRDVVINLRKKIESYGGSFYYNSLMEDLVIDNGSVKGIIVNGEKIDTDCLVLAIGHSARDTFLKLNERGLAMKSKPFAVGIRIIHKQDLINKNQYPINYPFLPAASYKLTYKSSNNKGVYSFCMCPGGYVVDARSNSDGLCVNGMSNNLRDSKYANSAIIVTVNDSDYGPNLFDGMYFQQELEKNAKIIGNNYLPVQKFGDYKKCKLSKCIDSGGIVGRTTLADINQIFSENINVALKEGIDYFGTKIEYFNDDETVIVAPESRTSSPICIIRDDNLESNILGIYPCGEGAGYAGGITTSAIDGMKVFESIYKKYKNF